MLFSMQYWNASTYRR